MTTRIAKSLTRAAARAARPARRGVVRALRHHSARTQALTQQFRQVHPVDGIRSWFLGFFLTLRASSHRASLKALLRRPAQLRAPAPKAKSSAITSRRPRRVSATSPGWFAFATQ
jgi:hypothetical protein